MLRHDNPFATDRLNEVGDFIPEWDVSELGRTFTDAFSTAIDAVRSRPGLDPNRKIHAFLGPAGYGKTHLFGRIHHKQGDRVHFVFIQAITGLDGTDKRGQLESVLRWRLVEALLHSATSFAPLRMQIARLLTPSFRAYFDQLSARLKERSVSLRADLSKLDPLAVLEVFGEVEGVGAYHLLADAVRAKMPHCSGPVLRAVILGASPAADGARWWLRGEADQLSAERLVALRLPDESPPLLDILVTVAELLRAIKVPLVVCFDQLDELFKADKEGFTALTTQLMSWLQTVPNLLMGVGSLETSWDNITKVAGFRAFADRVVTHTLPDLSGQGAAALIEKRMATWSEADPKREAGWPFDLSSAREFVDRGTHAHSPRSFIHGECHKRFSQWLGNRRQGLIRFVDGDPPPPPPEELFRESWAKELEAVKAGKKSASDTLDAELWAGVEEALTIAQLGKTLPDGVRVDSVKKSPINPSATDQRYSIELTLSVGGRAVSVIVAVTKKDGGQAFGSWQAALEQALPKSGARAVVVWHKTELSVGKTTKGYKNYEKQVTDGKVRPFPLDEHEGTFHQLETLRRITLAAKTGNLLLGKETVGLAKCRELIVKTKLLEHLKLFDFVFKDWPGLTPAPVPVAPPPPAVPPPPPPVAKPVVPAQVTPPVPAAVVPTPPVSLPPPPVVPPPPAIPAVHEWVVAMLAKTVEYLKKKGQSVQPAGAVVGPTFVRLKVELRGGADFGKVRREAENLKVHLALEHEPLILSQAGYVSLDVQRPDRQTVFLPPLIADAPAKLAGEPAFPVGIGVTGHAEWLNLSEPEGCHLLVAGTTGSGKSEFLKAALAALAARLEPTQVKFRLIDPKRVTFNVAPHCPYLGGPVVYDGEEALPVLDECVQEMERRYKALQQRGVDHVRHLGGADAVPRWVVVMDEFADLMTDKAMKKELEPLLKRLGAKARAAGIHLILGTQRPDASVVTPLLRANLPGKIGLMVGSEKESKLFLDEPDAAYLFGKGDLVWKRGGGLTRLQSPFVPKAEFDRLLRVS